MRVLFINPYVMAAFFTLCSTLSVAKETVAKVEATPVTPPASGQSRKQIVSEEYKGRPIGSHPGSLTAGFLAVFPGSVFHGLGQFHLGQEDRGLALMASEVTGLGLIIAADLLDRNDVVTAKKYHLTDIFAQSGWALFFGSWFADIIGATRGTRPFDPFMQPERSQSFELGYAYLNTSAGQNQHLIDLRLNATYPFAGLGVIHSQSPESGSWLTQLDGDLRLSDPDVGFLGLGARVGHSSRYEHRWAFVNYAPLLRWSLDLGVLMSSLENATFLGHVGYGASGYLFDRTGIDTLWQSKSIWVPRILYRTGIRFSLSPKFVSEVALLQDDAQWVGPAVFQPTQAFMQRTMLTESRLSYLYQDIKFHVTALLGQGQKITLALEYRL